MSLSSPTGAWRSAFHRLGMAAATITVSEPLEAQAASESGIPMEESIPERRPDGGTATFAVSAHASRASDATTPQNDAPDLSQGEESAARRSFVVQWQDRIDQRRAGVASPATTARRRSRSLESDDQDDADTAESPTRYSARSKQARTVCCDCARTASCGLGSACLC